jgi:hypothetical protein
MSDDDDSFWGAVRAALVGFVAALLLVFLGFFLAAGGHGWVTPFFFSPIALLLFPSAGALAFARPSIAWLVAAITIVALYIVADVVLYLMTVSELSYFRRVTHGIPGIVGFWFLLWGGGNVAALIGAYRQIVHRRSTH